MDEIEPTLEPVGLTGRRLRADPVGASITAAYEAHLEVAAIVGFVLGRLVRHVVLPGRSL